MLIIKYSSTVMWSKRKLCECYTRFFSWVEIVCKLFYFFLTIVVWEIFNALLLYQLFRTTTNTYLLAEPGRRSPDILKKFLHEKLCIRTKFRGDQPNGVKAGALHCHLAASESKIDSRKKIIHEKTTIRTKFRGY